MKESASLAREEAEGISTPKSLGEIGLRHFAPYLLNRIMGRYNQSLQDSLGSADQSVARMRTLAVLSVIDGLMTNELAVYAVIEQSTLSRTLDAMEAAGQIRREAGKKDSRVRHIHITDKGREIFNDAWPRFAEPYRAMFAGIPVEEHKRFVGTLQKILGNIREHDF